MLLITAAAIPIFRWLLLVSTDSRVREAHQGKIELISQVGAGSTFTLIIPIEPPDFLQKTKLPMSRILIIEDEVRISTFLEKGFQASGFITTVVHNGQDALELAMSYEYELIILDLGLPGKDGLAVLEELRGQGAQMPIIILTARDDISDKISGFENGADDYLTKPFRFEELLARVRARLRTRTHATVEAEMILEFRNIVLDLRTRRARIGREQVELSAREFTLAETFLRHPDQVLSREQLLNQVWGYDYDPCSNIVDVYVGYLRKKLGNDLIETVRGMGYRLKVKG
jgi:DNA-binding response OmpR family regulator